MLALPGVLAKCYLTTQLPHVREPKTFPLMQPGRGVMPILAMFVPCFVYITQSDGGMESNFCYPLALHDIIIIEYSST